MRNTLLNALVFFTVTLLLTIIVFFFTLVDGGGVPRLVVSYIKLMSMVKVLVYFGSVTTTVIGNAVAVTSFLSNMSNLFNSTMVARVVPCVTGFAIIRIDSN